MELRRFRKTRQPISKDFPEMLMKEVWRDS